MASFRLFLALFVVVCCTFVVEANDDELVAAIRNYSKKLAAAAAKVDWNGLASAAARAIQGFQARPEFADLVGSARALVEDFARQALKHAPAVLEQLLG